MSLAIITITRNDLSGLCRTVASIEAQTTPPTEHWIIDGASADGTRDYLAALPIHPSRHIVSEPDSGIYDAMNKGVARASADFVWFLNSGDTCADPAVVADLLAALRARPDLDALYGKSLRQNRHGLRSIGGPVTARDFRVQMPVCHQAIIYRRTALVDHPYSTDYRLISDWIVTRQLFESDAPVAYLDRHLAVFDLTGVSSRLLFAVVREKLHHNTHCCDRLLILLIAVPHAAALWIAHRTGLYALLKKRQHSART
jgi:glycosyltransferase involved in cell wall biosynthesis